MADEVCKYKERHLLGLDEKRLMILGMILLSLVALGLAFYLSYIMPARAVKDILLVIFNFIQIIVTGLFALVTGHALNALKRKTDQEGSNGNSPTNGNSGITLLTDRIEEKK